MCSTSGLGIPFKGSITPELQVSPRSPILIMHPHITRPKPAIPIVAVYFLFCFGYHLLATFTPASSTTVIAFSFFISSQMWPPPFVSFLFRILVILQCALFVVHRVGVGLARSLSRSNQVELAEKGKNDDRPIGCLFSHSVFPVFRPSISNTDLSAAPLTLPLSVAHSLSSVGDNPPLSSVAACK